jgi:Kef-type K+ transport system membrane component KefB
MDTYSFLMDIALILVFTKVFGVITKKFHIPQVVGALIGGILLGPAILGVVEVTSFLMQLSELGVILLMFIAGMETNIKGLIKNGKTSFVVALLGVILPIIAGTALSYYSKTAGNYDLTKSIFIGIILAATSVSITVEALKEMGQFNTKVSDTLLGAAILDDILGIIFLAFISGTSQANGSVESGNIYIVLLKIILFFVFAFIIWYTCSRWFSKWFAETKKGLRRYAIAALVICLIISYVSEKYFGVANIIGAFLAGLIFSDNQKNTYIMERCETVSYMFLSPVFFASVGLKADIKSINSEIIIFAVLLTIMAIMTKLVGCGVGSKLCGYSIKESLQIGIGMIARGEVALIIANKGIALNLLSTAILSPIIIMVVITTVFAPILLKLSFRKTEIV